MMVSAAKMTEIGPGERRERQRRLWLWGSCAAIMLVSATIGFFTGFTEPEEGWIPVLKTMPALVWAGVVLFNALFAWGSWVFFRYVDELELADNLWASMIGYYAYLMLFPFWWALARLDMAPEPDGWIILIASLAVTSVVYVFRKVQHR